MSDAIVKNWEKYQHYKDRNPPWIKLHVHTLNDLEFMTLAPASKCLLMLLWILASEAKGTVNLDLTFLRFRLHWPKLSHKEIKPLITGGFIDLQADASNCYPEAYKEEAYKEEAETYFGDFWSAYPRKTGKGKAKRIWSKLKNHKDLLSAILSALEWQAKSEQWTKESGAFIPHPSTYLNEGRWEDEAPKEGDPNEVPF